MYSERGIDALSHSQIKKMLKGYPVRVKDGNSHKMHLSLEQHKKLDKAKGKGVTIMLDPLQQEIHKRHGHGIFGDLFKTGVKVLAGPALHGLADLSTNFIKEKVGNGVKRGPRKVGRPRGTALHAAGYGHKMSMAEKMAHVRASKGHKGHKGGEGIGADVLKNLVGLLPF